MISKTANNEYTRKKEIYQEMGIKYYVVYNPQRKRKPRLEVYSLENQEYVLLGNQSQIWLEEVGFGIGLEVGTYQQITREWLYWYDERGERFLTPEERSRQAETKADRYAKRLRELGIDPDSI